MGLEKLPQIDPSHIKIHPMDQNLWSFHFYVSWFVQSPYHWMGLQKLSLTYQILSNGTIVLSNITCLIICRGLFVDGSSLNVIEILSYEKFKNLSSLSLISPCCAIVSELHQLWLDLMNMVGFNEYGWILKIVTFYHSNFKTEHSPLPAWVTESSPEILRI